MLTARHLKLLFTLLIPLVKVLNDPSRSEHGNPDFVFLRGSITVGYTETKDIGVDLDKTEKSDQLERYLGYSNLILTDYLEFRFFRNGQRYGEPIRIGTPMNSVLSGRSGIIWRARRCSPRFSFRYTGKIKEW